jgi:uncharacterized repeat protein (TIGR03843 family)
VSGDERPSGSASLIPRALAEGRIELLGLLPNASNAAFLARCRAGDDERFAVYKPSRGETPLWDFPQGTLHRREVAAFVVAAALGWPNVPPTVLRDGPEGPGSLQLFVRFQAGEHYFTLQDERREDFRRVALFDLVVNNADRKAGHCLLGEDGRIWVIDHGVCFSDEPKLRTVIWEFLDEPIPDEERADLRRLAGDLDARGDVLEALAALLAPEEVDAVRGRLAHLLTLERFPGPEPGTRPYPWPPI